MFNGVTRRRSVPLAFTTKSPVLLLDGLNAANAARDPSGDQSAPTRSKNPRSMTDQRGGLNLTLPVPSLRAETSTPYLWGSNLAYKTREPLREKPYPLSKKPPGEAVMRTSPRPSAALIEYRPACAGFCIPSLWHNSRRPVGDQERQKRSSVRAGFSRWKSDPSGLAVAGCTWFCPQTLHNTLRPSGDQPMHVVLPGGPMVCRSEPLGLIVKPKFGKTCPTTTLPFRPGTTLAPAMPLMLAATTAGPRNTTAAPAATAARRIRPGIAIPPFYGIHAAGSCERPQIRHAAVSVAWGALCAEI